jgi:hypothetical protein
MALCIVAASRCFSDLSLSGSLNKFLKHAWRPVRSYPGLSIASFHLLDAVFARSDKLSVSAKCLVLLGIARGCGCIRSRMPQGRVNDGRGKFARTRKGQMIDHHNSGVSMQVSRHLHSGGFGKAKGSSLWLKFFLIHLICRRYISSNSLLDYNDCL